MIGAETDVFEYSSFKSVVSGKMIISGLFEIS
jgi:hypothetical protein